jgi:hypothetical protein
MIHNANLRGEKDETFFCAFLLQKTGWLLRPLQVFVM